MCRIAFLTYAHNVQSSLKKSAESILNQTHRDLKYYLIDNESTDDTWNVIQELADQDSRIIAIQGKNTLETLPGYIAGIKECKYFAMHDADDLYDVTFAEKMIRFAEEQNLDIAVCGAAFYQTSDDTVAFRATKKGLIFEKKDFLGNMDIIFPHFRATWAKVFRIDILKEMDFSDFNKLAAIKIFCGEDQLFCLETLRHAKRVGMLGENLYTYFVYPESVTYRTHPHRDFAAIFLVEKLEEFLTQGKKLSEKNDKLFSQVCIAEFLFAAENILESDTEIKKKLSRFMKIAGCPAMKRCSSNEQARESLVRMLLKAANSCDMDEESAQLFFVCIKKLNAGHIIDRYKEQGKGQIEKEGVQIMSETSGGNSLESQIENVMQMEGAEHILEINADFAFSRIPELPVYDIIILRGVAEHVEADDTKMILDMLLAKVKKQVMLITPEYCQGSASDGKLRTIRKYHPVMLQEFDFAYSMYDVGGQRWQMYNIFPPGNYEPMPCDAIRELSAKVPARFDQKLRIAYIIPNHNVTGGIKALLQQMKHLALNGHIVKAYYRTEDATCQSAIPSWSEIKDSDISEQHVLSKGQRFLECIHKVDVVILAWIDYIPEFENAKVPVVLWEQGSPNIFGDAGKALSYVSAERIAKHYLYRRPVHIMAVSSVLIHILQNVYNRKVQYFPNGMDTEFYRPGDKISGMPVIMIMGHPNTPFKGTEFALEVLDELWNQHVSFKVWWVLPGEFPTQSGTRPYQIEMHIKPEQERLAELYRQATLFFSTSLYESFSLPPMEAMASGTTVVATDNGGIRTYGRSGENCILVEQGDREGAVAAVRHLLENKQTREALEKAGRETALHYSFDKIVPILESCLYRIID